MGIDDLFKQMQQDELEDELEAAKANPAAVKMTPINYGKARGIAAQRVYAAMRNNKLDKKRCECGRTIVDVTQADLHFGFAKEIPNDDDDDNPGEEGTGSEEA